MFFWNLFGFVLYLLSQREYQNCILVKMIEKGFEMYESIKMFILIIKIQYLDKKNCIFYFFQIIDVKLKFYYMIISYYLVWKKNFIFKEMRLNENN